MTTAYDLADRYTAAFIAVAAETGVLNRVADDLQLIDACIREEPDLPGRLASPSIEHAQRSRLLRKAFGQAVHDLTLRLLDLLVRRGRVMLLGELYASFVRVQDRLQRSIPVTVTSARPIDRTQRDLLEKKLQVKYGASGAVRFTVDPALIAGLRITAGEQEMDNSIQSGLRHLRATLSRGG